MKINKSSFSAEACTRSCTLLFNVRNRNRNIWHLLGLGHNYASLVVMATAHLALYTAIKQSVVLAAVVIHWCLQQCTLFIVPPHTHVRVERRDADILLAELCYINKIYSCNILKKETLHKLPRSSFCLEVCCRVLSLSMFARTYFFFFHHFFVCCSHQVFVKIAALLEENLS